MCVSSFCTTLRCIVYIACNLPPSQFDLLPLELELSHLFPCPCLMPMAAKNAPISRRSKQSDGSTQLYNKGNSKKAFIQE